MTDTIAGIYTTLVTLDAAIDNPTTITATGLLNDGLQVSYPGLTVVNAGSIAGNTTDGEGILLAAGGSVTNQSGGAISGGLDGIVGVSGAVTVVNAGTIAGTGYAVQFASGFANRLVIDPNAVFSGTVTGGNAIGATVVSTLELASAGSAGTLSGLGITYFDFAQVTVDAGAQWNLAGANTLAAGTTLTNAGTLSGPLTMASGGFLSNSSTGTITAPSGAAVYGATGGAATVVNAGVIAGGLGDGDQGIFLAGGASVTNQSGGSITGYQGIYSLGIATVVNAGRVTGNARNIVADGVFLHAGGSVTNQSGGTISGYSGIYGGGMALTVVNAGSIAGTSAGVFLQEGGSVTNQSGGAITGQDGIVGAGGALTMMNAGSIVGNTTNGIGVDLNAGGSVTNQSGGSISGYEGIYGAGTVVNAGSITGGSDAVRFTAGHANRLVIDPKAVFSGTVTGGNAIGAAQVSTLELASTGSAGTLSGLGTTYVDFTQITVDAGARWTLTGANTIAAGATLTNAGTLTDAGTLTNAGTLSGPVTLAAGGVLSNASTGMVTAPNGEAVYGATGGAATVVNAGVIAGGNGGDDQGICLAGGGSVTNQSGGVITGASGIVDYSGAAAVVNAGTITGSSYAVKFAAGYANRLVIDPNAVFAGTVTGGNTIGAAQVSTLELASAGAVGTLSGFGTQVIDFAQVTVDAGAQWTLQATDTIEAGVTLTNAGTLSGPLTLAAGGVLSNATTGTVTASGGTAVFGATGGPVTVVNAGVIADIDGRGIDLAVGASITNQSGGSITGYDGIVGYNAAVTVTNAGTIAGANVAVSVGVLLFAGGSVTNQSSGAISGYDGVFGEGGAVTAVNSGSIAGGDDGIGLVVGGSVTNQSGGTISGSYGVNAGGAVTVVNAGTITGRSYAVKFAGGFADRLVIDPNAVFTGQVNGGNAIGATEVSTLELASAGSAGTLAGLGATYVDFAQVTVDAGAQWTLAGANTLAAGATLTNAGTLTDAGALINAGAISGKLTLAAAGVLTNASTGTITASGGAVVYGTPGGAATVVNAGLIANTGASGGEGIDLTAGGGVTNQSGGTISGYDGIFGDAGTMTVVNAGTITGSRFAVWFAAASASRLITNPGAVFTGYVYGGGGVLELTSAASAGTLSGFGTSITNFASLQFDAGAAWTISGTDSASGLGTIAITGFADGDTIDLSAFVAVSDTFANNTLVLTDENGAQDTLAIQGTFTSNSFQLSSDGNGGTDVVVCFAAGTQIGTPDGEVPVEQLQVGDRVLTAQNGPRPVTWIGHGKVLATRGRRSAATPVIVRTGALADNVPNRDLHVTKAHSLYIDDVLIPVEFLVNHRTILWDDRAQEVTIYHVELDSHDVLIANGAPAESYRDDGNRWLFHNANAGWQLPPQDPYAPVLTGGPVVDAAWRRLLDRAGPRALPPLTDDPDLHLVVDGTRVDAEERQGSVYVFRLPHSPKSVVIASREAVPAEFGIARDPRSLGVALRRVAVRQGAKFMLVDAADDRLTVGFHAYEADGQLRWTDGYAELPIEVFARFDKGAELMLHLGGAMQYPDERARPARAAA